MIRVSAASPVCHILEYTFLINYLTPKLLFCTLLAIPVIMGSGAHVKGQGQSTFTLWVMGG